MKIFDDGGKRSARLKGRTPRLGDRHLRTPTLGALTRATGPAASSPTRKLASAVVARVTGPTARTPVLRSAVHEQERRVVDPGWRMHDSPRSRLYGLDARQADAPEIDLLGDPPALEAELREDAIVADPARSVPERDETAEARDLAARDEAERRTEEEERSTASETERRAEAIMAQVARQSRPAPGATQARDPERDAAALRAVDSAGDDFGRGRPPLAQKQPASGADRRPTPTRLEGQPPVDARGVPLAPGSALLPEDARLEAQAEAVAAELARPPAPPTIGGARQAGAVGGKGTAVVGAGAALPAAPAGKSTDKPGAAGAAAPPPTVEGAPALKLPAPEAKPGAAGGTPALATGAGGGGGKGGGAGGGGAAVASISADAAAGGTTASAVEAWKGRVGGTIGKVKEPPVPDSNIYIQPIHHAAADPNAVRNARIKKLEEEGKKAITPGKEPDKVPAIPEAPMKAVSAIIDDKCNLKINLHPEPVLPDLVESPHGHVPVIGAHISVDEGGFEYVELPPSDPNAKGAEPERLYKPGGIPPIDKDKLKKWNEFQTKLAKEPAHKKRVPGKGVAVKDEAPPPAPVVPDFAKVDVGDVLARLLAQPEDYAKKTVESARESYAKGALKNFPSFAAHVMTDEQPLFAAELQHIADAAGLKKEDLDKKVADRRKVLIEKKLTTQDKLSTAHEDAKNALQKSGQSWSDEIASVRASLDDAAERKAAAAKGGVDLVEQRKKRDGYYAAVDAKANKWLVAYKQNGDRFKEGLTKAFQEQMQAYNVAAKQDEWLLKKDAGADPVKLEAAQKKYDETTKVWLQGRQKEINKVITPAKRGIDNTVDKYQEDLRTARHDARERIRAWYDAQIGYERSWWSRLIESILSWVESAHRESKAWETARAEENKVALDKDMMFLAEVRLKAGEEMDDAHLESMKGLGEEKYAILKAYYRGGKDAVQALAEGIAVRIQGQRRPEVMKAFEKDVNAISKYEDIGILVAVGQAQTPGFETRYKNLVDKVWQAVDQWGTEEGKIFEALDGLTSVQAKAVELEYEAQHHENMRARLKSELDDWLSDGHDWDKAQAMLEGDPAKVAAVELDDAMEGTFLGTGWGTDEDKIFAVLRNKTPEQIDAIKKAYKAKYGRDLVEKLDSELDDGASTQHDVQEMYALTSGRIEDARAIELDRAMRGNGWTLGYGTDRKAIEGVYDRVRKEVEAEGQANGWTSKQIREEIARRNQGLEEAYEKKYGYDWKNDKKPGQSALSAAFHDELSSSELDVVEGLRDQDWRKVDAARIHIEHDSFWYADDKVIRSAMSAQYYRDIADGKRDKILDFDRKISVEREIAASTVIKVKNLKEGQKQLSAEDRRAGFITRAEYEEKYAGKGYMTDGEFEDKFGTKNLSERKKAGYKLIEKDAEAEARLKAPENMKALGEYFDAQYKVIDPNTGEPMSFGDVVKMDTSGSDHDAVVALLDKGYLTADEEVQFAVQGCGTDEEKLKEVFKGKSKAEIDEIARAWAAKHPADAWDKLNYPDETPEQRFRRRIAEELSGRDEFDILDVVDHGEPQTPEEMSAKLRRQIAFEKRSTNSGASSEIDLLEWQATQMDRYVAELAAVEARRPDPSKSDAADVAKWNDEWEEKHDAVERQLEIGNDAVELHRSAVDAFTDFVVNVVSAVVMAVAVIVTVILTVVFPPAGIGLGAAIGAALSSTTFLVGTALATAAATIATKAALKGAAYGWEDIATDATVGIVDALAAKFTAGMGSKLLKMGFLARMAGNEASMMARIGAHALAQGAEGFVQGLPSALAGNLLNDQNYEGNAFLNILGGSLMQAAPSAVLAGALGGIGGISKPPKAKPPASHDLLNLRGDVKTRAEAFKKWKVENPGKPHGNFLKELDEQILKQQAGEFERKALERSMRKELLEHIPIADRKVLAKTPIEVLSEADFKKLAGSEKAQAMTMFRRGKATIVIKAGADLEHLGEEGIHLLQARDPATKKLVKSLDEAALRNWEKLPVEKQLDLYHNKITLEIDAHEKLIAGLEKKGALVSAEAGATAKQLEKAKRTLGELKKRLTEVEGIKPRELAEMGVDPAKKPQYLKEKPRLFAKEEPKLAPVEGAKEGKVPEAKAPEAKAKPVKENPRAVLNEVLGEPEMRARQIEILEGKPVSELTSGEKQHLAELKAQQAKAPLEAPPVRSPRATELAGELDGLVTKKPAFDAPGGIKANAEPLPANRMSRKLGPGETAHQVGPPWMEVRTKRVGNRFETRGDFFRKVQIRNAAGELVGTYEEVLLRKPGNRWGVHGTAAKDAGELLEKKASLAFTEQHYKSLPGGEEAWGKSVKRLEHQVPGKGSGFDELLAVFDDPVNPKKAKLHIVEVKEGGKLPGLKKFGAVGENLEKNLERLKTLLKDKNFRELHGLGDAHVAAINDALAKGRFQIEVRVGPKMKLPAALDPALSTISKRTTVLDKLERIASASRKLRMAESHLNELISKGVVAVEDVAKIKSLRADLEAALESGSRKKIAKAVDAIHTATSGRSAFGKRNGLNLDKEATLLSRKPTRLAEPLEGATKVEPPKTPGTGGSSAPPVAPAAAPPTHVPPGAPPTAPSATGKPHPTTVSEVAAGATDPVHAERVRYSRIADQHVMGWGDFDVTISESWASKTFSREEWSQLWAIRRKLVKVADLEPVRFASLPVAKQERAIKQAVSATLSALGVPRKYAPIIEFKPGVGYGVMRWGMVPDSSGRMIPRATIVIEPGLSVGDAVGTAVHEARHYYQRIEIWRDMTFPGSPIHPQTSAWAANFPGVGTYHTTAPRYFTQPIEVDAETWGRRLIDLLPEQWPRRRK